MFGIIRDIVKGTFGKKTSRETYILHFWTSDGNCMGNARERLADCLERQAEEVVEREGETAYVLPGRKKAIIVGDTYSEGGRFDLSVRTNWRLRNPARSLYDAFPSDVLDTLGVVPGWTYKGGPGLNFPTPEELDVAA